MSARSAPVLPLTAERIRPGVWCVTSSRPGEADYTVGWNGGSGGSCTCPGFQRWHHCRHLDYVRTQAGPGPASRKERPMQTNPRALQRVEPQALAVQEPSRELTNLSISDIRVMSELLSGATGFLPKGVTTPGQVFAVILTGQEVGIGPMASLRHIPLVEGKADPDAELLLALIRHRYGPETIRVKEATADHATVEWRQPGWPGIQSFTWTRADSERAGLAGKDNHRKYPAAMNRSRAVKHVARSAFPEVALGLDLGGEESAADAPPVRPVQDSPAGAVQGGPAPAGLLTADELAPGGVHRGERGGILESRESEDCAIGEMVGLTECASCGTVAECIFDGKAYICADSGACVARSRAEPRPDAAQAAFSLEAPAPPEPPATDANRLNAKHLDSIQAHLERTGTRLAPDLGPLEQLSRAEASTLLRDLGRLPNAGAERPPAAADTDQVAF